MRVGSVQVRGILGTMSLSDRVLNVEGEWLMGKFIPADMLRHLAKHIDVVPEADRDEMISAIRDRAAALVEADLADAPDRAARGELAMAAVVLAAHEQLCEYVDPVESLGLLRHVFGELLARTMGVTTRKVTGTTSPLDSLEKTYRAMAKMYGSYFQFEFDRPSPDDFVMQVHRCYFRDFFERHGALEVTTVLCAWDANWMRAIDTADTGLVAERTSLMSLGDQTCRFAVAVTEDLTATYSDVLEIRGPSGAYRS